MHHVLKEGRLLTGGLQGLFVGLGQFVVALFQLFIQPPDITDVGRQRLLHADEGILQMSDGV